MDSGRPAVGDNLLAMAWVRVWRYRLLLMLAVALGGVAGLSYSLTIPNQYQSVGKLFVRPGVRDLITPEFAFSDTRGSVSRISGSREAVLNEMQVLSGPQLFDKVVERVGVEVLLAPYDPAAASGPASWDTRLFHSLQTWWFASRGARQTIPGLSREKVASMLLEDRVSIVPESGASVIACSYVAHSPETARMVVNAVLEAARDVHREVFDTMSSLSAIESEMNSAEGIARAAEKALREFRVEKDIHAYDSQYAALVAYLATLDQQADTTALEMGRKLAEREVFIGLEQLRTQDRTTRAAESFVLNPTYSALTGFLTQLLVRELSLDDEKANLPVIEYQRRKAALKESKEWTQAQLKEEGKQLKFEGAREENPHYVRIVQSLDDLEVELKGLDSTKTQTEALRTKARNRLNEFEQLSPELRALELDAQQKRTTADGLIESVTKMKTVQRLERLNLSSVQIMHGGTFEPDKIAPRRGWMVIFGAFGGAVFGIAMALFLAGRDPRVRSAEDLVQLGLPADGVLRSRRPGKPASGTAGSLPPALAAARDDIARFWASVPYDRRATEGLKIAFVSCGGGADAGRAAATFAIGLAVHGGESVAYVSCAEGGGWLAEHLGLEEHRGWSEVLSGDRTLEEALVATSLTGLAYLPVGVSVEAVPHPMAGSEFLGLLDRLAANHRFVVVELPNLETRPEGRSVLGVVEAVELVVRAGTTTKTLVQDAVAAVGGSGARLLGGVLQAPADPGAR